MDSSHAVNSRSLTFELIQSLGCQSLQRKFNSRTEKFRPVAEVFGRVFVLTARGVIKYEGRRREPLGGSRGLEMLFSAYFASQYFKLDGVKITGIFSNNNNISHFLLT